MRNCFFEDDNFTTIVRPVSFIKEDNRGYFIEIRINKSDVVKFMMLGLVPTYVKEDDIFILPVAINNVTKMRINGIRVSSFDLEDERLQKIPISLLSIKELALKVYSKNTDNKNQQCYATRVIFDVKLQARSKSD